jgi:hypothetical protein
MIANVRTSTPRPVVQNRVRWSLRNFWPMRSRGEPGAIQPRGALPGTVSMLPHRVTSYRRPAFWSPQQHFKRQEYLVEPPNLPGTAIPYTLFHPLFIPGLQGYMDVLPWNFAWAWGRNNFERFGSVQALAKRPVQRQNAWIPVMRTPQGPGTGRVFQQPRPNYIPPIINPGVR